MFNHLINVSLIRITHLVPLPLYSFNTQKVSLISLADKATKTSVYKHTLTVVIT